MQGRRGRHGIFGVGGAARRGGVGADFQDSVGGGESAGADCVRDMGFGEGTGLGGERSGIVDYGVADCCCHFIMGGVGEADVKNCLLVIFREADGVVYGF